MRRVFVWAACLGLLILAGSAAAFVYGPNGEGNPYYAPAIPDRLVPTMDGNLADWAWMPSQWVFTMNNAPGQIKGNKEWVRDDFDVAIYGPAWIPATNMYAFAVHKVDNIWYDPAAEVWGDNDGEAMQWCTDPDASGGPYPGGRGAQQNFFSLKDGGFVGCFQLRDMSRFIFEEPHCFWQATMDISTGSFDLELMYHLWDYVGDLESESEIHTFEAGQSIGGTFLCYDQDNPETYVGMWWHFAEPSSDSGNYARFEMLPLSETEAALSTPVETTTWGQIKSLLQ